MKKINVAELLKDCPKGMELDCTMFDNVTFVRVDNSRKQFPIEIAVNGLHSKYLTKEGCFHDTTLLPEAKCVISPKGKTTWDGFQIPFKDGDIAVSKSGDWIGIVKFLFSDNDCYKVYVAFENWGKYSIIHKDAQLKLSRLATEEEKQKLFDAIKANDYRWDAETKTLEKLPKFKVGDKITDKNKFIYRITEITDKGYKLHDLKTTFITFEKADLLFVKVMDIFDINSLIPFESRVLVRSSFGDIWRPAIYGFTNSKKYYIIGGSYWTQCIPYEANKELLGTTNDCDDFYKIWK